MPGKRLDVCLLATSNFSLEVTNLYSIWRVLSLQVKVGAKALEQAKMQLPSWITLKARNVHAKSPFVSAIGETGSEDLICDRPADGD
jgi:hypothetical protein